MEMALLYIAGALILGMASVGAAVGIGVRGKPECLCAIKSRSRLSVGSRDGYCVGSVEYCGGRVQ